MRIVLMCVLLMLAASTAAAQDGLRSASLPERGPGQTVTIQGDLFVVPPDFYRTRPDPEPSRLFFPQVLVWPPGVPGVPYPASGWQYPFSPYPQYPFSSYPLSPYAEEPVSDEGFAERREFLESMQATAEPPPTPPPPMVPGPPKTFYVIPGCYAGDRPPPPGWLRPGCDRANMRVIPPE